MQINDAEHTKLSVWVGGNHSNARGKPTFQKLVAAGIPNNPPRWPEATAIVKKILRAYRDDAKDWERISDWVERIGWPRFFELTGLPFTKFHINNWKPGKGGKPCQQLSDDVLRSAASLLKDVPIAVEVGGLRPWAHCTDPSNWAQAAQHDLDNSKASFARWAGLGGAPGGEGSGSSAGSGGAAAAGEERAEMESSELETSNREAEHVLLETRARYRGYIGQI